MNAMIKQAVDHWRYVSPLLTKHETKEDFDALVEVLNVNNHKKAVSVR